MEFRFLFALGAFLCYLQIAPNQLKDVLRKLLDNQDRILVVEIRGDWASRRAENNLAELIPPRGGPALMLWKRRWGE